MWCESTISNLTMIAYEQPPGGKVFSRGLSVTMHEVATARFDLFDHAVERIIEDIAVAIAIEHDLEIPHRSDARNEPPPMENESSGV